MDGVKPNLVETLLVGHFWSGPYLVQPIFGPNPYLVQTHIWSGPYLDQPNLVGAILGPSKFGVCWIWGWDKGTFSMRILSQRTFSKDPLAKWPPKSKNLWLLRYFAYTLALPTSSIFWVKYLTDLWNCAFLCLDSSRKFLVQFMVPFSSPKVFDFWPLLHKGQIFFAPTENIFDQQVLGGKLAFCVKIWAL